MKLLLDECTPRRLRNDFPGHQIQTVPEAGLNGFKNGRLLRTAVEQGFEVLITVDQRLRFQQNLSKFQLAVIILVATPCRYPQLKPLAPKVLQVLETIRPSDCILVQHDL
jgi:Domain of unknown function (DUF5615)